MKTSKMKVILSTIAMVVGFASATNAQSHNVGKTGKGPHGGTVQEAEPNHAEILVKDKKVYVYILDANAKPMSNKGITGTATLQFPDGSTAKAKLMGYGKDGFVLENPKAATYVNCIVKAMVKKKKITAKFTNIINGKPKNIKHKEDGHKHKH